MSNRHRQPFGRFCFPCAFSIPIFQLYCPVWKFSVVLLFFFIACSKLWMSHTSDHTKCILMRFFFQYFPYALHYLLAESFFAVAYIWFAFMMNHRQHKVKILLISVAPDIAVSYFSIRMLNIWWWLLFLFFFFFW